MKQPPVPYTAALYSFNIGTLNSVIWKSQTRSMVYKVSYLRPFILNPFCESAKTQLNQFELT